VLGGVVKVQTQLDAEGDIQVLGPMASLEIGAQDGGETLGPTLTAEIHGTAQGREELHASVVVRRGTSRVHMRRDHD
jgi:hypothetical protein